MRRLDGLYVYGRSFEWAACPGHPILWIGAISSSEDKSDDSADLVWTKPHTSVHDAMFEARELREVLRAQRDRIGVFVCGRAVH